MNNRWLVKRNQNNYYATNSVRIYYPQDYGTSASSQTGTNTFLETRLLSPMEIYRRAMESYRRMELQRKEYLERYCED